MGSPDRHSFWERLVGGPAKCEVRSTIEGELSDDTLDGVMGVLSDVYEAAGEVTRVGRRFLWTLRSVGEHRDIEIALVQRHGSVVVCARHRFADVASSVYILYALTSLMLVIVATFLLGGSLGVSSIVAGTLGGLSVVVSTRAIYRRTVGKHSRRLRFVVGKIEETIKLGTIVSSRRPLRPPPEGAGEAE